MRARVIVFLFICSFVFLLACLFFLFGRAFVCVCVCLCVCLSVFLIDCMGAGVLGCMRACSYCTRELVFQTVFQSVYLCFCLPVTVSVFLCLCVCA